jgi:hypothetical protein
MNNQSGNSATNVWMNQPAEPLSISVASLRQKAQKLERRVWWRNVREYAAAVLVIAVFGYYLWKFPAPLVRAGSVLLIAGTLLVVYTLHKRGASRRVPGEVGFQTCLAFHRAELERQRDLLRSVWTWYLLPFVPGITVFLLGLFRWTMEQPNAATRGAVVATVFGLTYAGCWLVFIGIAKLNYWAADKIQREIEGLAALEKES